MDVIVSGKNGALLRAAAPLESEQCGHIAAGQRCMVVDAATLDDGRERLLVRHATATGWCSAKVVRCVAGETVREDVDETRAAWLANAAVLRDMVRGMAARGPRAWSEGMEKALMAPLVVSEDDDVLIRRTKQTNYWALAKEIYGTLARVAVGNLEAKLLRDALAIDGLVLVLALLDMSSRCFPRFSSQLKARSADGSSGTCGSARRGARSSSGPTRRRRSSSSGCSGRCCSSTRS